MSNARKLAVLAAGLGTLALVVPAAAPAFTVDSAVDAPDALIDGDCDAGGGDCTLRAAIEEANASLATPDPIDFDPLVFDGEQPGSTIALVSALPPLTDQVAIEGPDCGPPGAPLPCVTIGGGDGGFDGLGFAPGAEGSSVQGLSLTGFIDAVVVQGPPDTALPVTVGGDLAGQANLISGNEDDAVSVRRVDGVEVAANRGTGNEQFIELENPAGPGNFSTQGAAEGLQAPEVEQPLTATELEGRAEPGALIRVFAKQSPGLGELDEMVVQATADLDGEWSAVVPAQPEGRLLGATQTVDGPLGSRQTSELSDVVAVSLVGPQATITMGPSGKVRVKKRVARVSFAFTAANHPLVSGGLRFECSLDGGPFLPCTSPEAAKLRRGRHSFLVRARDALGREGPPATRSFKLVRKKRKRG